MKQQTSFQPPPTAKLCNNCTSVGGGIACGGHQNQVSGSLCCSRSFDRPSVVCSLCYMCRNRHEKLTEGMLAVEDSEVLGSVALPPPPCCGLCLEPYNDSSRLPKVLPCGHTYCQVCLESFFKRNKKGVRKCPLCRGPVLSGMLHTNVALLNMMQDMAEHMGESLKACKDHGPEKIFAMCKTCDNEGLCRVCMMKTVSTDKHYGHLIVLYSEQKKKKSLKKGLFRGATAKKREAEVKRLISEDQGTSSDSGQERDQSSPSSSSSPQPSPTALPLRSNLSSTSLSFIEMMPLPKPFMATVSKNDTVFLVDKDRKLLCRYQFGNDRFELVKKTSNRHINFHDVRSLLTTRSNDIVIQHSQMTSVVDDELGAVSSCPDTKGLLLAIDENEGKYIYLRQLNAYEFDLAACSPPHKKMRGERERRIHSSNGIGGCSVASVNETLVVADRNTAQITIYRDGRCYVRKCRDWSSSRNQWVTEDPYSVCVTPHGLIWVSFSSFLAIYDAIREVKRFKYSSLGIQGIITNIWYSDNGYLHVQDEDQPGSPSCSFSFLRTFKIIQ